MLSRIMGVGRETAEVVFVRTRRRHGDPLLESGVMSAEYDVTAPPSAEEWLAMDEAERIHAVEEAHRRTRSPAGQNPTVHATIHVIVENQLAEGYHPAVAAYARFRAAGIDRHVTVHALASVVTQQMMAVAEQQETYDEAAAKRDFDALDPAAFKPKKKP